jgi:hypothetical protein
MKRKNFLKILGLITWMSTFTKTIKKQTDGDWLNVSEERYTHFQRMDKSNYNMRDVTNVLKNNPLGSVRIRVFKGYQPSGDYTVYETIDHKNQKIYSLSENNYFKARYLANDKNPTYNPYIKDFTGVYPKTYLCKSEKERKELEKRIEPNLNNVTNK